MTPEQIASVGAYMQFDRRFYEQQGSGLGLVIAKRLVELYEGGVIIDSVVNQGTTVTMSLRLRDVPAE
jgi:signal transduction histidine kinase